MSLESAEMVKHVLNSFLATCVVFANEVSNICENEGANAWEVFSSLTQDSRVGKRAFLRPGLGFSGGTLARDVKILSRLAPHSNRLFSTVYEMNQKRNDWILRILKNKFTDGLRDRTIVLVGITYKPNTSTVRRSPAVEIAELLRTEGAKCNAIDPKADLTEWTSEELGRLPFTFHQDFERAFWQADAAVLVTEWPEFWNYDWAGFASKMRNDRSEFSQDSTAKLADGRSALPLLIDTKNHFKNTSAVEKSWTRVVPGLPL